MKKGLLRTLSAVVAISMLFCMSMVAFAEVRTTTSVTEYDMTNGTGTVTVKTEVAGAQGSEQVAFLVQQAEDIIWIDQKAAAADGTASSSYTVAKDLAIGAIVKVGTASTAATAIVGNGGAIQLPNYEVHWTINDGAESKVVAVVGDAPIDPKATSVNTIDTVTFYVICAPNEQLATINGEAAALVGGAISFNVGETKVDEYNFVFKTKAVTEGTAIASNGDVVKATAASKKASVAATATNATEFGIVVAKAGYNFDEIDFGSLEDHTAEGAEVIKLAALGANAQGQFVIVINDDKEKFFVEGAKYEARVYAVKNGTPVYGATFELN